MSERLRLPQRRSSITFDFQCGPHHYTATISYFPGTDQLAEIFIGNGRAGSDVDASAKDFSHPRVAVSPTFGAGRNDQKSDPARSARCRIVAARRSARSHLITQAEQAMRCTGQNRYGNNFGSDTACAIALLPAVALSVF